MVFLKSNPFIRLLIPIIFGISLQFYYPLNFQIISIFLAATVAAFIVLVLADASYHKRYWFGINLNIFFIVVGMLLVFNTKTSNQTINNRNSITINGIITKPLIESDNYYKTEIEAIAIKQNQQWYEYENKFISFFEPTDLCSTLKAGQQIIFTSTINDISGTSNPFGFDYKKYMSIRNISQTVYLKNNKWHIISTETKGIQNIALNIRERLIHLYEANGIKGDNLAVLSALTLGYKNKLDEKIRTAYSGAGAMHVLAVSGLHVGIIYGLLELIFAWLALFKRTKRLKALIIISAVWIYAFITGLSPSVLRASIMFTFMVSGQLLYKRTSIYNSLAASAFILLLFNPLLIFDIGFQLSYTAVVGIIFFQPKIKSLVYFPFKPIRKIWELTAVSIAAQIATFPITLFNFHQFPTYFWLSNIVVTLIAMILIPLAILLLVFSTLPKSQVIIADSINFILTLNIDFVNFINKLPGAIIEHISFNQVQIILFYLFIASFSLWIINKKYMAIFSSLSVIFILGLININTEFKNLNQEAVCVYHIHNESAIQFVNRNQSVWLHSENYKKTAQLEKDANLYWRTFDNQYFDYYQMKDTAIKSNIWYCKSGYWTSANSKGMFINQHSYLPKKPLDTINLDYIFVSGNPTFSLKNLSQKIKYKKVIIDGSVPHWKSMGMTNLQDSNKTYLTKNKGAFISYSK